MTERRPDTGTLRTEDAQAGEKARPKRGVGPRSLRGRIVAGVLIIIPLAVTAFVIRYVYSVFLSMGAWLVYLFSKALFLLFKVGSKPVKIDPSNATYQEITVAVVLTILMLYLLGWLGTNVAGRRFIEFFESFLSRIPLVDTIYVSVKRMVQALSGVGKADAGDQQVVLIEFPHDKMWALAFMTGTMTDRTTGKRYAAVFVPTTPNPTGGYMVIVPLDRVIPTDWTAEEALSMILSGGASVPSEVRLYPAGTLEKTIGVSTRLG